MNISWVGLFCVQSYVAYKLIIWENLVTMDAIELMMTIEYRVHYCERKYDQTDYNDKV